MIHRGEGGTPVDIIVAGRVVRGVIGLGVAVQSVVGECSEFRGVAGWHELCSNWGRVVADGVMRTSE